MWGAGAALTWGNGPQGVSVGGIVASLAAELVSVGRSAPRAPAVMTRRYYRMRLCHTSVYYRMRLKGAVMTRPNQDRTKIEVWVKRSSLAWLNAQAKRAGKSRSALVRDLLVEAITARQPR